MAWNLKQNPHKNGVMDLVSNIIQNLFFYRFTLTFMKILSKVGWAVEQVYLLKKKVEIPPKGQDEDRSLFQSRL